MSRRYEILNSKRFEIGPGMAHSNWNLKRLSAHLGLSQTTVSRALNGFPEVSEQTRARVVEAARLHNYRPSPAAAGLATGKSRIIGHVLPIGAYSMIDPHFSDFAAGASEAYAQAGYDMLIRVVPPEQEEQVYRELSSTNRVDGVVIHGPRVDDPRIPLLAAIGLPFVVHGRSDAVTSSYSWLDVNNRRAFRRATDFLIDLGHRRIGLVNGMEALNFAARRRRGYEEGLAARGIGADPALMFSHDMSEPYGYRATRRMLELAEPPSAILYASILPAIGGLRALGEAGLKPGRDVSMIAYDDELSFLQHSEGRIGIPFFTSLRSSIRAAGREVGEMLIGRIASPLSPTEGRLWEAEFVIGQTTGPRRADP
jgi:LacI family transcriptional regulator